MRKREPEKECSGKQAHLEEPSREGFNLRTRGHSQIYISRSLRLNCEEHFLETIRVNAGSPTESYCQCPVERWCYLYQSVDD